MVNKRLILVQEKLFALSVKSIIMKYKLTRNFIVFCAVFVIQGITTIHAQQERTATTVTGKVVDESSQPLPGVTIVSFITGDEAFTDEEGNFSLDIAADRLDRVSYDKRGYEFYSLEVTNGNFVQEPVVLTEVSLFYVNNEAELPYKTFAPNRVVSAISSISGEELESYPSATLLEALSGRIPGLVINQWNSTPGAENMSATIRGVGATFYIDGIQRSPDDLSAYEVERVQVIKDLSGRAALGIIGSGPIIWITTKTGKSNINEINVSAERGISSPTSLPNYLDAYDYATLYNEALDNDGLTPRYTDEALNAYQSGASSLRYPNVDYYDRFVKENTSFTRANINFTGGDEGVNYFSMVDYVGSGGYEAIGKETVYDRFKIRGSANIRLNEFMRMNVNLSGTYGVGEYPNQGGGANRFNMFNILSTYPANATPIMHEDKFVISDNYPLNLQNELVYGGFAESVELNTQNIASLIVDLDGLLEGLSFTGSAAFDANNIIANNKGGTEALYRRETTVTGADTLVRVVEREVDPTMSSGYNYFERSITGIASLDYERLFDEHALTLNASYYNALQEERIPYVNYQPNKIQDVSFRGNYAYDERYVLQLDLSYTGNIRLPQGERYNAYPTVGAAWNISEEEFFQGIENVNYLKLYSSYGIMGVNNFNLPGGYNPYYLGRTLWQDVGGWQTGVEGQRSGTTNIYNVLQFASEDFSLPERSYFNVGVQSQLFKKSLSLEVNYFHERNYNIISTKQNFIPSLFGTGGFLPATNFGENTRYGVDGMIQFSNNIGDLNFSIGANGQYLRGKEVVVDEPLALPEYRKRGGKDSDLFWLYDSEGLYQNDNEIESRDVAQSWGSVQPGDIRYVDFNGDGVVNEQDVHTTGAHAPRVTYGLNFSLDYKGFNLFVLANGVADGEVMLNNSYFWNNSTTNNYSQVMLDRWPETNKYPRLTTQSQNNYQGSTFWLADAAYLNIKHVELSYSLPKSFLENMEMRDLNVFVRGKNLLTISDIDNQYNLNPENMNSGINTYPISRTITFGVSSKF